MKIHQTSNAIDRRRRFIEAYVTSPADPQDLNINTSILFDLFLIISTKLYYIFSFDFSIRNIDVFLGDVNVIEEMMVHVVVVGLRVIIFDRIVFV